MTKHHSKKDCSPFWGESEYLPISALVDYWCENDPECQKAKFYALVAACNRGEVQYIRSDGKDYQDPVMDLAKRGILDIHRESFDEWMKKFPDPKKGQDILPPGVKARTTYHNIIGALVKIMLSDSPGGHPQSVFNSKEAIMDNIEATFPNKPGLAKRTLQEKFAEGERSLSNT
jgi:hypothetical protein